MFCAYARDLTQNKQTINRTLVVAQLVLVLVVAAAPTMVMTIAVVNDRQ
jgi:hypothetical protein